MWAVLGSPTLRLCVRCFPQEVFLKGRGLLHTLTPLENCPFSTTVAALWGAETEKHGGDATPSPLHNAFRKLSPDCCSCKFDKIEIHTHHTHAASLINLGIKLCANVRVTQTDLKISDRNADFIQTHVFTLIIRNVWSTAHLHAVTPTNTLLWVALDKSVG